MGVEVHMIYPVHGLGSDIDESPGDMYCDLHNAMEHGITPWKTGASRWVRPGNDSVLDGLHWIARTHEKAAHHGQRLHLPDDLSETSVRDTAGAPCPDQHRRATMPMKVTKSGR